MQYPSSHAILAGTSIGTAFGEPEAIVVILIISILFVMTRGGVPFMCPEEPV